MFDPCGTRKLEGDEILKRLAEYLGVTPEHLSYALTRLLEDRQRVVETIKNIP